MKGSLVLLGSKMLYIFVWDGIGYKLAIGDSLGLKTDLGV